MVVTISLLVSDVRFPPHGKLCGAEIVTSTQLGKFSSRFRSGMKVGVDTVGYCNCSAEERGAWEAEDPQKEQQSLMGA